MSTLEVFQCGHCLLREDLAAELQSSVASLYTDGSGEGLSPSSSTASIASTIVEYINAPDHSLTLYTTGPCPLPECHIVDFAGTNDVTQQPSYDSADNINITLEQRILNGLQGELEELELRILATSTEALEEQWVYFDPDANFLQLTSTGLMRASNLLARMRTAIQSRSPRFVYEYSNCQFDKEVSLLKTRLITLHMIVTIAEEFDQSITAKSEPAEERRNECAACPNETKLAYDLAMIAIQYPCSCHDCYDCHLRALKEMATRVLSDEYVWLTDEKDSYTVPLCCESDDYSEEAEMANWRTRVQEGDRVAADVEDQVSETAAWPARDMEVEELVSPHSRPVSFEEMAYFCSRSLESTEQAEHTSRLDADSQAVELDCTPAEFESNTNGPYHSDSSSV